MFDNPLTLICLIDGEKIALSVKIVSSDSVDDRKKRIKTHAPWKVSIPIVPKKEHSLHHEMAALRKQLPELERFRAEVSDSSVNNRQARQEGGVYLTCYSRNGDAGRPEEEHLHEYHQCAHDHYLEIFVYNGQAKPSRISDDDDLRKMLKIAKTTSKTKLAISLETPSKSFSAWTFKDVCEEYSTISH
ncbi:hypothetical protein EC957_007973 [Mortierella hygrophila]|uniref:Crinkler effector protein N-terminal domain-containing protein n=1 Tax=Mortierella hygrophila TaxID=979708 RepID=A0A9P6EXZ1_9FUNG|nr:hypothetical protein EC957_007973 [Mortierella hygrophila]